jgi:hypothetical protein
VVYVAADKLMVVEVLTFISAGPPTGEGVTACEMKKGRGSDG